MTKGGGVIEGRSDPNYYGIFNDKKRKRKKIGTKYKNLGNKTVPDNFILIKKCFKISDTSPYVNKMVSATRHDFKIALKKGFIVSIRGGIYIKQSNGQFLVYKKPASRTSSTSTIPTDMSKQSAENNSYTQIYNNLLRINNSAARREKDK